MENMHGVRRKNIGFFANDLDDEYCRSLCVGAAGAAEELDCNLFVFSGRFYESAMVSKRIGPYAYQYNTSFAYANAETLDALVVTVGTVAVEDDPQQIKEFLESVGNIPVVFTGQQRKGCGSVTFEQYDGMRQMVEHLIKKHNCRKIAFVGGPPENPESGTRKQAYLDVLAANRIPYNENYVTNGDFTVHYTEPIAKLLDNCGKELDAICFANDMMAVAGYELMRERGLEPGKDILVTGYDNCVLSASLDPILTTVSADPTNLGFAAVVSAFQQSCGLPAQNIKIDAMPIYLPSCGCSINSADIPEELLARFPKDTCDMIDYFFEGMADQMRIGALADVVQEHFKKLSRYLLGYEDVFDENDPIKAFSNIVWGKVSDAVTSRLLLRLINGVQRLLLYRWSEPELREATITLLDEHKKIIAEILLTNNYKLSKEARGDIYLLNNLPMYESSDLDSQMEMIANHMTRLNVLSSYIYLSLKPVEANDKKSYKPFESLYLKAYTDGKKQVILPDTGELVPCTRIFENSFTPNRRRTMVLSSLFYRNEHYGLFVCELSARQMYFTQMLTMQICLIVKNVSLISQLNAQNAVLNSMASEDTLTGLLNRRGFYERANAVLHAPENRGKPALIGFIDMDNLKQTNDMYGHDEGNFALNIIAGVLRDSFGKDAAVARIGGDEFNVLDLLDSGETPNEYRRRLKKKLEQAAKNSGKPYNITFSVGFAIAVCESSASLESYVTMADNDMYIDKRLKPDNI